MKTKKGSILIFTLWVLIILSILSIALSRRATSDIQLARYEKGDIKATYLAKAGVFKMLAELAKDASNYDSLNEDWNSSDEDQKKLTLRGDTVLYGASDEMARLNLNGKGLKTEHLIALGLDNTLADAILQYRNKKDNKQFEFIEELFLVEGMTREFFSSIKDLVTIYRGDASRININTAGPEVLYAIAGDLAYEVLDHRKGDDGEEGTEDDGIFKNTSDISMIEGLDPTLFTWQSNVFRIRARSIAEEDGDMVKTIEAVVDRNTAKFYHWKEY